MKKSQLQQIIREELANVNSKSSQLSIRVQEAIDAIDDSMSYKDFAAAVALF
jgi:hypothetical protein